MTESGPSEEGYSAGEAFLQIVPAFAGALEAINREAARWGIASGNTYADRFSSTVRQRLSGMQIGPSQNQSRQQGDQAGRTFADTFKARVEAALRSLPDVRVDADSTEAEVKLAELRSQLDELSRKTVGVDIDAGAAVAEIDRIKAELDELARESPDIAVKADTTAAAAKLEEIQQQVRDLNGETATVDVDDGGSIDRLDGKIGGLAQSLLALSPLAAPVGASIVAGLAGALETIGALGAGLLTAKLGFSGVGDAVKLLGQQQAYLNGPQAQQQAQAAAQRQISSANEIRSAEQGLADARRNAAHQAIQNAEQVANAEQNLADVERQVAAQRRQAEEQVQAAQYTYRQSVVSVTEAEQQLMAAREAARRQLEAYANAQADSKLAAEQAQIDLQTAQANYDAVMRSSSSTELQREQAALDLAKARQALKEADQSATQAEQDNSKAQKQGVAGAPGVVSATQQVAAAKHAQRVAAQQLADAERAQAQAQRQGAEQISKAEQQVADAVRQQSWQQQSSAEAIERAQQQVATAMEQSRYASQQAGSAGASSLYSIRSQLAKLSPAVVAFARYWRSTWDPISRQLKSGIQNNLLPGVERGLKALQPMMPTIERFFDATAKVLGRMAAAAGKAFDSPFWQRFFQFMTRNVGPILMDFGRVLGNVAKGFAGLAEAFGPLTRMIGSGLVGWSRSFAQFGESAKHSQWFQSFLAYVKQNGPVLLDALGKIVTLIVHVGTALAPLGSLLLKAIDGIATFLDTLNPNQLLLFAAALGGVIALISGPVGIVVALVAGAALIARNWDAIRSHVQPFIDAVHGVWDWITNKLVPVLKGIFLDAWHGIQNAISIVTRAIQDHRAQLTELGHAFRDVVDFVVQKVLPILGPILKAAFQYFGDTIAWAIDVISGIVDGFNDLVTAAKAVGHWFSGPFVHFFQHAWNDITGAFSAAWRWVSRTWSAVWKGTKAVVLTPIRDARDALVTVWSAVRTIFSNVWRWVSQTWSDVWGGAKKLITAPIDAARSAIGNIWDAIKRGARAFVSAMGTIWSGLEHILAVPINWVARYIINDGLIKAWNFIAHAIPGAPTITQLTLPVVHAATGTVVPGYAPGVDSVHAMVSPGEAILRPEVTRWIGADTIHGWNAAARGGRLGYALGGVVGGVQERFAGGGIAGALNDINPAHWASWLWHKITGPISDFVHRFGSSKIGQIIEQVPLGLGRAAVSSVKHLVSSLLTGGGGGFWSGLLQGLGLPDITRLFGGGPDLSPMVHGLLIKEGLAAAGAPDTSGNEDAVNIIVSNESGWNPKIVNRTDSNWLAGHPSVGLMQTIASTFQAYVPKALRNIGPFAYGVSEDPIANLAAGIRYALSRYGSLENVPGVVAVHRGEKYVGYDAGGWLLPGVTAAFNNTGKPEAIFTSQQASDLAAIAAGGAGLGDINVAVSIGDEAIDPRLIRITNVTLDKRVAGAVHATGQGVPGGPLAALASPHARAVSRG